MRRRDGGILKHLVVWLLLMAGLPLQAAPDVHIQALDYRAGDTQMQAYLAYDASLEGPHPGVLVVPEWWGLDDYARRRVRELAELGYVALAVDMYGGGKATTEPEQAGAWAGEVSKNPQLAKTRFMAALETLKDQKAVDAAQIGAIGYCFGGTVVLNMARAGVDMDGVVSFHGTLPVDNPPVRDGIEADVLVLHGEADAYVTDEQMATFKRQMESAGADFRVVSYPGAKHSFTNPAADDIAEKFDLEVGYDAQADQRSWREMRGFFQRIFAD